MLLTLTSMFSEVANPVSQRRTRMDRTPAKALHLATFHSPHSERSKSRVPSASWNMQIVMPYVRPHFSVIVPSADAGGWIASLKGLSAARSSRLPSDSYLAVLELIDIAADGEFRIRPEIASLQKANRDRSGFASALNFGAGAPNRWKVGKYWSEPRP